jgi:thiamine-phosphate pyrophosphorylase
MALAARLPAGAALVYRTFGAPDAEVVGRRLLALVRARGGKLLIGADAALAARLGADGVHQSPRAARRARACGVDAVVVSAVFPSRSPSAGTPIGVLRLAQIARLAGIPVYALGGVNDRTAGRLKDLRLAGLAAVEGF